MHVAIFLKSPNKKIETEGVSCKSYRLLFLPAHILAMIEEKFHTNVKIANPIAFL